MKKLILTFALLLTVSFAFATNNIEETLPLEFIEVDLIKVNVNNNIELLTDCFGQAIAALEYYSQFYDFTEDQETELLNIEYALCWLENQ